MLYRKYPGFLPCFFLHVIRFDVIHEIDHVLINAFCLAIQMLEEFSSFLAKHVTLSSLGWITNRSTVWRKHTSKLLFQVMESQAVLTQKCLVQRSQVLKESLCSLILKESLWFSSITQAVLGLAKFDHLLCCTQPKLFSISSTW